MENLSPAVFAVGNSYQIMQIASTPALFWVRIGDKTFYDNQNGVMRTRCHVHSVTVPMSLMNKHKSYTVCIQPMLARNPYYPKTGEVTEAKYSFRPITGNKIRIYHIADAHNQIKEPLTAAGYFGKFDLLILNGDIFSSSEKTEYFDNIYILADALTKGEIPIVFSRGNHDLRGEYAENMADYIPTQNGSTYYTFNLGKLWGIVLDCGEDKDDTHPEYGGTVCCHDFRLRQTEWLKDVIKSKEYSKARYRIIVSHNPFTYAMFTPFDIEKEIYTSWIRLIGKHIKPNFILCGHLHKSFISRPKDSHDTLGEPCPVIVGSDFFAGYHLGCGIELDNDKINVAFYDSHGCIYNKETL